jgi:diguanylate cyclase (GGDEF)-like protein
MINESHAVLDVVVERNILSQALLDATAQMARSTAPEAMLRSVCDSLSASSKHIRLVWMTLGDINVETLHPEYIVGQAAALAAELHISHDTHPTVRKALDRWETVHSDLQSAGGQLCSAGMCTAISLPVGKKDGSPNGIVTIYADQPGYFEKIGIDLFTAFIHLVNSSLEQSLLLCNLAHIACHDQLTGMLNRRGIHESLAKELSRCRRRGTHFSIILFDIDRFKLINDRLGHQGGDIILRGVAEKTLSLVRKEDCVGRWGGEEFICIATETSRDDALLLAERIRRSIREDPVATSSGLTYVTASFGVACYPEDADSIDKLLAAADTALYDAKREGRDRTVSAASIQHDIYGIGNMLDAALIENRIVAAYQPIVDLRTGEIVAEETLARLMTPLGEIIPAGHFIHAASQLQLMHRIDQTIMMQAISHCVSGLQNGSNRLTHFVNISPDLLRHRELVDEMLVAARTYCRDCASLVGEVKPMVIEITEHELLADIDAARDLLTPFIDFGLRLALDDFGSGYSSFRYLVDLPISFIKIDGSLVQRVNERKVRAVVQGIQDTADKLGITTLAEYVENEETEAILKEIGVHWGQGYYYGKPVIYCHQNCPDMTRPPCQREYMSPAT